MIFFFFKMYFMKNFRIRVLFSLWTHYFLLLCPLLPFFFLNKNSSYRNINKYRQSTVEHNLTHQPETIRLTQWFPTGVGEYLCLSRGHWECLDTVLIITAGGVELLVSSRLRPPKIPLNIQQ